MRLRLEIIIIKKNLNNKKNQVNDPSLLDLIRIFLFMILRNQFFFMLILVVPTNHRLYINYGLSLFLTIVKQKSVGVSLPSNTLP